MKLIVRRRRWLHAALLLHRWSGLVAAPFFLVLCLTGGILVFRDQVDRLIGQPAQLVEMSIHDNARPWSELARAALQPGERLVSMYSDPKTPHLVTFGVTAIGVGRVEDAKARVVDRTSGQLVSVPDPERTFTGYVLRLHAEWFAGFWGEIFGGAVALLTLVCLASGVPLYGPHVRAIAFGFVRRDKGSRVLQRDLHNVVAAIVLAWCLLITGTGVLLAFSTVLFDAYRTGELKAISTLDGDLTAEPVPYDVDRALAVLEAAAPGLSARYIIYPGTDYSGPRTFTAFLYGQRHLSDSFLSVGIVGADDGRVYAIRHLPWVLMATGVARPLHFGAYGGIALRIIWLSAALATTLITCNGAWLWLHRRSLKRCHRN